jgi:hypothetical protein
MLDGLAQRYWAGQIFRPRHPGNHPATHIVERQRACRESAGSMAVENQTIKDAASEGTALERYVNVHMGNFIHVFLTLLAVLVMVAASIALFQIVHHGFPQLWRVADEYTTLHELLQKILLLAIAGELGLLLLFHRATAAVEVVMFVIARRMVATDVTAFDLLMGSVALSALLVVRFYFLPGKPK